MRRYNPHLIRVPEDVKRKWREAVCEEIITNNCSECIADMNSQLQEAESMVKR